MANLENLDDFAAFVESLTEADREALLGTALTGEIDSLRPALRPAGWALAGHLEKARREDPRPPGIEPDPVKVAGIKKCEEGAKGQAGTRAREEAHLSEAELACEAPTILGAVRALNCPEARAPDLPGAPKSGRLYWARRAGRVWARMCKKGLPTLRALRKELRRLEGAEARPDKGSRRALREDLEARGAKVGDSLKVRPVPDLGQLATDLEALARLFRLLQAGSLPERGPKGLPLARLRRVLSLAELTADPKEAETGPKSEALRKAEEAFRIVCKEAEARRPTWEARGGPVYAARCAEAHVRSAAREVERLTLRAAQDWTHGPRELAALGLDLGAILDLLNRRGELARKHGPQVAATVILGAYRLAALRANGGAPKRGRRPKDYPQGARDLECRLWHALEHLACELAVILPGAIRPSTKRSDLERALPERLRKAPARLVADLAAALTPPKQ